MNINLIPQMFEELSEKIDKVASVLDAKQATPQQATPDNSKIENCLDRVVAQNSDLRELLTTQQNQIMQEMQTMQLLTKESERPTTLPPQRHLHTIEIASSKVFISMISLCVLLFLTLGCNFWQLSENRRLNNNDIKYRYIKTLNHIDAENIQLLETIFEYTPDKAKQKTLRKWVEDYERTIKEKITLEEQTRLKQHQAEQLLQKAEQLKEKSR